MNIFLGLTLALLLGSGGATRVIVAPASTQTDSGPAAGAARGPAPTALAAGERPNIVVLMLDDLPADAAERLLPRMPHIEALFLEGGQRWTDFHAQDPLCCPGRAGFLTGLYSRHHGVTKNDGRLFDPRETIATALDREGYQTIHVGKYLNGVKESGIDRTPPGWDHIALTDNGYYQPWWVDGTYVGRESEYHTEVLAEYARGWLREAPADQPLLISLNPFATHGSKSGDVALPVAAPRHKGDARCDGIGRRATPAYNEADVSDKPTFIQTLDPVPFAKGWPLRKACESLLSVDDLVGEVRDELAAQGRSGNTLWILTADNPNQWGDHRWTGKSVPWGTRMPLWTRWPDRTASMPTTVDHPAQLNDLAPTIVEVAGGYLGPYPTGQAAPDGESLLSAMLGSPPPAREALFIDHPADGGARAWSSVLTTPASTLGEWRYVEWGDGFRELYDEVADPWNLENVADRKQHRRTLNALSGQLDALRGD